MSIKHNSLSRQVGSTLIETSIALFILAIGLLGIIAMQATGVKSGQRAQLSSEALFLANDMADRIAAYDDLGNDLDDGDFNNLIGGGIDTANDYGEPSCPSAGCNRAQQITFAAASWKEQFDERLPGGRGMVRYDIPRSVYRVIVMWDNEMTGADGTGCGSDADVDMACYVMEVAL